MIQALPTAGGMTDPAVANRSARLHKYRHKRRRSLRSLIPILGTWISCVASPRPHAPSATDLLTQGWQRAPRCQSQRAARRCPSRSVCSVVWYAASHPPNHPWPGSRQASHVPWLEPACRQGHPVRRDEAGRPTAWKQGGVRSPGEGNHGLEAEMTQPHPRFSCSAAAFGPTGEWLGRVRL